MLRSLQELARKVFAPAQTRWWLLYSLLVLLNLSSFLFSLLFVDMKLLDRLHEEAAYTRAWNERFRMIGDFEKSAGAVTAAVREVFLSEDVARQSEELRRAHERFVAHKQALELSFRAVEPLRLRHDLLAEIKDADMRAEAITQEGKALLATYPEKGSSRRLAGIGTHHEKLRLAIFHMRSKARGQISARLLSEVEKVEYLESMEAFFNGLSLLLLMAVVAFGYRSVVRLSRSERSSRTNEERLGLILASNGAGIMDLDLNTGVIVGSDGFCTLHGISVSEASRLSLDSFLHRLPVPERERFRFSLDEHFEKKIPFRLDYKFIHPDGGERWMRALGRATWNTGGIAERMVVYVSDVTEEKLARHTLENSERRLKLALEGTSDSIWDWDIASDYVFYSPKLAATLGYLPEEIEPSINGWKRLLHPEESESVVDCLEANLQGRLDSFEMEHRLRTKHGNWVWILTRGRVIERDHEGRARRMAGAFTDVSQLKIAEHSFRESEWRMKELMGLLPVGVILNDSAGHCVFVNKWWLNLTGTTEQETLGFGWQRAIHPDDREAVFAEWALSIKEHRPFQMQYRLVDAQGQARRVMSNGIGLTDQAGTANGFLGVVQDINSLLEAKEENEFYRTALDQADIVAITDAKGVIVHANDPFCEISGYDRQELLGKNHRILNSGTMPEGFFDQLWRTIREGKTWKGEICNRAKDGHLYWVDTVIVPQVGYHGRPNRFIAIRRDITNRKMEQRELQSAREKAEAATQAKSQFLANISHELRTPLNGIIGMAELLLDSKMSVEQRELSTTIQECGENLLSIVNELLDYSKIEAGKVELEYSPFALQGCVRSVVSVLEHGAMEKDIRISFQIDPLIPANITSDSGRLRQVLLNLGGNALKFTERGEISLRVSMQSRSDANMVLLFEVSDTGIGISASQLERLFQPFSQGDASVSRRYGGTGLGLIISKQLVEAMGGEVWVESRQGGGSSFFFTLPVLPAKEEPRKIAGANATAQFAAAFPLRVLLVDDNHVNQKLALKLLEKIGYAVDLADNGRAAIRAVSQKKYDLVLMDLQMPEMSGIEATRTIRATPEITQPKIVALTANAMARDRQACHDAGMDGFISKPIRRDDLLGELARVFHWKPHELPVHPAPAPAPVPEISWLETLIQDGFLGDREIFLGVVESYFERRALLRHEITESLQRASAESSRFAAHKMLGAVSAFGRQDACEILQQMEEFCRLQKLEEAKALLPMLDEALTALDRFLEWSLAETKRSAA